MSPPGQHVPRLLPLALLAAGIALHGFRIVAADEDPQRGSAFAMFATTDIGATRRVLATLPGDEPVRLQLPASFDAASERLADAPAEERARRLGQRILAERWQVRHHRATAGSGQRLALVRIEVVGLRAEGRKLTREVLLDVTLVAGSS